MKQYIDRKRDKAFIGAIIGAAASVAGGIIQGQKAKKEAKRQQELENHKGAVQRAGALTQSYSNQDYLDDFNDKISFKYGGAPRRGYKSSRLLNGGKRKMAIGGLGENIGQASGGVGGLISNIIGGQPKPIITPDSVSYSDPKTSMVLPEWKTNNTNIVDTQQQSNLNQPIYTDPRKFKCGGRKRK